MMISDKARVAIVHNHPIHYKHLLFKELRSQGLDFDVLFLGDRSSMRHEPIEITTLDYRSRVAWHGPYESTPAPRKIKFVLRELARLNPDLVVISGYYAAECWAAWCWAKAKRRPIVLWFESNEFDYARHWSKEVIKKIFCRQVTRAHVYGTTNKQYLVNLGIPPENIDLKRAVVDVTHFDAAARRLPRDPHKPLELLYVGRLAAEKNLSFLIKAFHLSGVAKRNPGTNLRIAGSGPLESELKTLVQSLGLSDSIHFCGYTSQVNLPRLYRSADFFILPSAREPWGLVALEAMMARLPVLVSDKCGCAHDLVTPLNGWTFAPDNLPHLTSLITALPGVDEERRLQMGDHSHQIATGYSAEACAQVIIRSLQNIYAARGSQTQLNAANSGAR